MTASRQCRGCGNVKPIGDFPLATGTNGKRYRRNDCRDCHKSKRDDYVDANRDKIKQAAKDYYKNNTDQVKSSVTKVSHNLKVLVVSHYGGKCDCCGTDHLVFLNMDHVGGGGAEHRRKLSKPGSKGVGGAQMYRWLRDNDYPEGFRVLCFNCNFAEYWGGCPHKEPK